MTAAPAAGSDDAAGAVRAARRGRPRSGQLRSARLRSGRPRRPLLLVGLALAVLGVLAIALGTTAATVWQVPSTATSVAALEGGTAAAVTAPGVLEARPGPVQVEATGEGEVVLALGRPDDVEAWLGADPPVPAAALSGFDPETGAVVVTGPEGSTGGAAAPPSAAGSDLWSQESVGEGRATLGPDPSATGAVLLAASAGGELREVTLTWPVVVPHPAAVPLLVAGGVSLLVGLVLLALARRGVGGPRVPRAAAAATPGAGRGSDAPRTGAASRLSAVVVAGVLTAGLAGCAAEPLTPRPAEPAAVEPAVTAEQLARIVDGPSGVAVTVAAADAARDGEALAARLDGPALAVRRAEYAVGAAALAADPAARPAAPPALGGERLVEAVPAAGPWPRFAVTVSQPPPAGVVEDDAAGVLPEAPAAVPVLEVLVQATPRSPYKVVAAADLLPGATFPQLTQTDGAVEVVAPDDDAALRVPPADALAHYADVLTSGPASARAGDFAPDAFTSSVLAEQAEEAAAGAQYLARTATHTPRPDEVWALRTPDGGAVVVGVLDATRTFAANTPGVRLTLPADVAALGGRASAASGSITAAEAVVLTVPPAGSDDPLAVVGAQRGFTAVTLA